MSTDQPAGGPTTTPAGPGRGGPLGFLAVLSGASPSTFASQLAAAHASGTSALDTARQTAEIAPTPVPTGLDPGAPPAPPAPPSVPDVLAPAVAGPAVQGGGTTGDVTLEAAGATDPRHADGWAMAGAAALDGTAPATAAPTAPPLVGALRPPAGLGELPQLSVPATPALPAPGAVPTATGEVAAALDANMGAALHAKVGGILGRAGAAGSAPVGEIAAARAAADAGRVGIAAATAAAQNDAAQAGDQEIARLRADWGAQRGAIVAEHKSAMAAESARTRDEATRTISEANSRAKATADEAERTQAGGGQASSGWWGKIKAAGSAVAGAARGIASSVVSAVSSLIASARQRVVGMITQFAGAVRRRVQAAGQAISALGRRVWSAMTSAVHTAQAAVARLAARAADLGKKLWESVKSRLAAAWNALKAAALAAYTAMKDVVGTIASALGKLQQIIKILKSGLLAKLFDAVKDPKKLAQPVVDKAAPLVGQVPARAHQMAEEEGAKAGTPPSATAVQRLTVQRAGPVHKTVGDQAGELLLDGHIHQPDPDIPAAPAGEGFWSGVGRHLTATGNHFLANWETTLINVVWQLLTFYPVLLQEGPKLWEECKGVIYGGGGIDRFDHVLGVLRHLVNIVAGLVATTGIWALIIGAFSGPGEVIVVGAYEGISQGVLYADIGLMLVEVGKAWYSATRADVASGAREHYLSSVCGSIIAGTVMLVLYVLGAIASRLGRAFKGRRAAAAEAGEGGGKAKAKTGDEHGDSTPGSGKPPPGTQHGIGDSNPARARELVNDESARGGKPEESAGHDVWNTKEGCVVCSDPCDFMGGKFADKFTHGPRAGEFTERFQTMEATADPAAKVAAEKKLVADLEAEPDPLHGGGGAASPGAQAAAARLGVDMTKLELDPRSSGRVFRQKGTGGFGADEIRLGDKVAGMNGSDIILPVNPSEAGVDGFMRSNGRPVQFKTLDAAPKNQPNKMVQRANDAFASAQKHNWTNVDLHIEARDITMAEAQTRWGATNRVPPLKPMPGGAIGRIRVHCSDGIIELPVPTGAPTPAPTPAPVPVPSGAGGTPGGGTGPVQ
jgi:hypothetical protein